MAVTRNRFIVDENGKRVSVVLPVDDYEELIEDLHDLAIVAERRTDPAGSHAAVKKRLKAGGLPAALNGSAQPSVTCAG
jgi:PHD/YefM family antitoxin component YafN of YafNO toxin-antitoxin module